MSNTKGNKIKTTIAFVISALLIFVAGWLILNRQYALDLYSVWMYEPSESIKVINETVGFTDKGTFTFYATKPSVENQEGFNRECPRQEAGSPILGCYTTDDRIYIYDLTNDKLNGMEEVTAAHEMLHAVWTRTSTSKRAELESQLRAAYEKLRDSELKSRMDYYLRTEPGEFVNELHSIIGTEVASVGEPLESYYEQFFNRSNVLALHQQYSGLYKELGKRSNEIYETMKTLADTIEVERDQYEVAAIKLREDVALFNQRANNGSFSSQRQFNAERAAIVQRTNDLNVARDVINADITEYLAYAEEYKEISKQIEVLNNSIDSFKKIEAAPSV